jgi:serine protease inhibitor
VTLLMANSQWTRGTLRPAYVATLADELDAAALPLTNDPQPINAWVSQHTAGLIDKVLDAVDPLTIAILINAGEGSPARIALKRANSFVAPH